MKSPATKVNVHLVKTVEAKPVIPAKPEVVVAAKPRRKKPAKRPVQLTAAVAPAPAPNTTAQVAASAAAEGATPQSADGDVPAPPPRPGGPAVMDETNG
jgi:hypothetical protein